MADEIPSEPERVPVLPLSASLILSTLPLSATTVLKSYLPAANTNTAPTKVTISLRPIGSTPALKQTLYKISATQEFQVLVRYIRKQLKCGQQDQVFCYINGSFVPGLDDRLGELEKIYGIDGKLMVSYCYGMAFG